MLGSDPNDRGGSIYVKDTGSTLHATSCVFFLNTAVDGGGVYNKQGSIQVYHSTITGNTAHTTGGGVYSELGSTVVHDSIIADNTAGDQGGGILLYRGSVTITRSVIRDNRQTTGTHASQGGGGVYIIYNAVVSMLSLIHI